MTKMSLAQFAVLIGKTTDTVRLWADQGKIEVLQIGSRKFIAYEEYERYTREGHLPTLAEQDPVSEETPLDADVDYVSYQRRGGLRTAIQSELINTPTQADFGVNQEPQMDTPNTTPLPEKAFVLLSGGLDSTTCLHIALTQYNDVEAISINYGQRHSRELEFAKKTCDRLGIEHKIINLKDVLSGDGVMLTDQSVDLPNMSYADIEGMSPTYVPFRNGTMLSILAAQAQKWVMQKIDRMAKEPEGMLSTEQDLLNSMKDSVGIYFGAHSEDARNWAYPDCTPEFIGSMSNAIYTGTYYTVRLHAPLMMMTKAEIVSKGWDLRVFFEDTWSCYAGGDYHCGTCPTCRSRKDAFRTANVHDFTLYQDDMDKIQPVAPPSRDSNDDDNDDGMPF